MADVPVPDDSAQPVAAAAAVEYKEGKIGGDSSAPPAALRVWAQLGRLLSSDGTHFAECFREAAALVRAGAADSDIVARILGAIVYATSFIVSNSVIPAQMEMYVVTTTVVAQLVRCTAAVSLALRDAIEAAIGSVRDHIRDDYPKDGWKAQGVVLLSEIARRAKKSKKSTKDGKAPKALSESARKKRAARLERAREAAVKAIRSIADEVFIDYKALLEEDTFCFARATAVIIAVARQVCVSRDISPDSEVSAAVKIICDVIARARRSRRGEGEGEGGAVPGLDVERLTAIFEEVIAMIRKLDPARWHPLGAKD